MPYRKTSNKQYHGKGRSIESYADAICEVVDELERASNNYRMSELNCSDDIISLRDEVMSGDYSCFESYLY